MKKFSVSLGAAALFLFSVGAGPADAISDSSKRSIGRGISLQANAWECNLWAKACDWKTSAKVYKGSKRQKMTWVKNVAQITGRGGSVSIGGSGTGVTGSGSAGTHSFEWTNKNAWMADLAGQARSGYLSMVWGIETCSHASTHHEYLGVKGTASACAG
ncbi:hypothetical protein [Streptomyces sp. t39]|uniref:hypothetical protein n=1 Tax=Streptomyces sp. t39 TaxID=1828156 RepID=UPI0011CD4D8C|nr:hypothetical protein [Streptomyces sp. t39]TXS56057.1 hypothetical protein EAO77_07880 [Streptomyces sp. t39]